ncbi:hypothetical protein [Nocardia xishanensis]
MRVLGHMAGPGFALAYSVPQVAGGDEYLLAGTQQLDECGGDRGGGLDDEDGQADAGEDGCGSMRYTVGGNAIRSHRIFAKLSKRPGSSDVSGLRSE